MKFIVHVTVIALLFVITYPQSKYTGVSWNKRQKKWQAFLGLYGKKLYGGVFDNDLDAAKKVNHLCDEHGIKHKTPGIGANPDPQKEKPKSSKYFGVCKKQSEVSASGNPLWQAQLLIGGKKQYLGLFKTEIEAAKCINTACKIHGLELKNPGLSHSKTFSWTLPSKKVLKSSKYIGVSWNKTNGKYKTQINVGGRKIIRGGYFTDDLDAAMKVNEICDQYGIAHKNPNIGTRLLNQNHCDKHIINTSQKTNPTKKKNTTSMLTQKYYDQFSKKLLLSSKDENNNIKSSEKFSDNKASILCDDVKNRICLSESDDEVCCYSENEDDVTVNSQLDDTELFDRNSSTKNGKRKRENQNKFILKSMLSKPQGSNGSKKEPQIEEENELSFPCFYENMLNKKK